MSDISEFDKGRAQFHRIGQDQANAKRRIVRAAIDENNRRTFDALQKSARKRNKHHPDEVLINASLSALTATLRLRAICIKGKIFNAVASHVEYDGDAAAVK